MPTPETSVHINVEEIPDVVRDNLASATLEFIRNIQRQPGGREMLDARIAAKSGRAGSRKRSP